MPYIFKPKKKNNYKRNYSNAGENRKQRQELYNMKEWKELSRTYKMEHPLCEMCLKNDVITPTAHVHHVMSFMVGRNDEEKITLLLDKGNLMALCVDCHTNIHNRRKKGA